MLLLGALAEAAWVCSKGCCCSAGIAAVCSGRPPAVDQAKAAETFVRPTADLSVLKSVLLKESQVIRLLGTGLLAARNPLLVLLAELWPKVLPLESRPSSEDIASEEADDAGRGKP